MEGPAATLLILIDCLSVAGKDFLHRTEPFASANLTARRGLKIFAFALSGV
jgi:hypothetical protein